MFGRVCVLMGGWSAEREVSLWSGRAVLDALRGRGVDAHGVDPDRERLFGLKREGFDRAFNVMHGTMGEDGTLQAVLELIGLRCTGSGMLASALAMDKLRSKRMWRSEGLPTPDYRLVETERDLRSAAGDLGYPFIVKPSEEGSSVGITKVKDASQIKAAFALARGDTGRTVMAEKFISCGAGNPEFTCAILGRRALPTIRIEPDGEFYDYRAKYLSDETRYVCPSGLSAAVEERVRALCLRAFDLLGARGWGRIDFLMDARNEPWLLEANLVPGMTSHSLMPMAARAEGIDFAELVWRILEETLDLPPASATEVS
ncbi:MAG: D-alanine--D-alanine ligase [Gammaproteobacteria bacterium]|nr:D-alanine--D-alanine ligase [Gammaproteobacteria bacterium]